MERIFLTYPSHILTQNMVTWCFCTKFVSLAQWNAILISPWFLFTFWNHSNSHPRSHASPRGCVVYKEYPLRPPPLPLGTREVRVRVPILRRSGASNEGERSKGGQGPNEKACASGAKNNGRKLIWIQEIMRKLNNYRQGLLRTKARCGAHVYSVLGLRNPRRGERRGYRTTLK